MIYRHTGPVPVADVPAMLFAFIRGEYAQADGEPGYGDLVAVDGQLHFCNQYGIHQLTRNEE